jgi:hypothetical protein|tara:strand:- start:418 stop:708 length:291 start_codon:yes stop_codon:yes gene_type:complete
MSNNIVPFPRLPTPSSEVSVTYLIDLVRSLEVIINQLQNPQLNFPSIPSSGTGNIFSIGDIYIADGGFLRILEPNQALTGSLLATISVGAVTVSVS